VLLVTHDPNVAAYAPRVIYMKDGQIVREERRAPETMRIDERFALAEGGDHDSA
jgi:ABC-type cobalamin/Fe3+-siderophores transport system ATPase subunit